MSEKERKLKKNINKSKDLKNHNKYYYGKDNPKISDAAYDKLKQEIFFSRKEVCLSKKIKYYK